MGLLLPVVLCALAAFCRARSPPLPPFHFLPLLSHGCNESSVLELAGLALQDINRDRKDGYVLSLNRVSDVREDRQGNLGSLYYFTLDVLETGCHVLSKKSWKDCEVRYLHQSVYGTCKALFYVNRPERVLYVPAYNCTLRPAYRRRIQMMCPDCPFPISVSDPKVLETAAETLAKYNSESTSKQYSVFQVTRASAQGVVGPAYFVEYLIKESPCTQHKDGNCALQPHDSLPVGFCHGSRTETRLKKFVSVNCEFFEPQVPTPGGENPAAKQGPADLPMVKESQQRNITPTNSPSKAMPKGSVQYLPKLDDEMMPEDAQGNIPVEAFPVQLDLTTNPRGESLDVSFLFLHPMEEKLVVLPFPKKEQRSAECPGPAQQSNPLVLPP